MGRNINKRTKVDAATVRAWKRQFGKLTYSEVATGAELSYNPVMDAITSGFASPATKKKLNDFAASLEILNKQNH